MLFKIQRKPSLTQRRRKVVRVAAGEIHPMWGGAAAEREWNERDAELQHIELRHWLRLRRRAKFTNQTIEEVAREEGVGAALTDVEVEAAKILEARSMPTRSRLWQATCEDEEGEKLRSVVVRIEHELVHVVATIAASPLGGRCDTIMRPPPISSHSPSLPLSTPRLASTLSTLGATGSLSRGKPSQCGARRSMTASASWTPTRRLARRSPSSARCSIGTRATQRAYRASC